VDLDKKSAENMFSVVLGSELKPLWVILFCSFLNLHETFLQNLLPKQIRSKHSCEHFAGKYVVIPAEISAGNMCLQKHPH
jgi:hypothetical protein